MHIIGRRKLDKFANKHSRAKSGFERWYRLMDEGTFQSIVDLRETFPQADPVLVSPGKFSHQGKRTTLTVFNIGSNVRLIAFINYKKQEVSIKYILTHDEYDRGNWKR